MNLGQAYVLIVEDDPDILKLLQTTLSFNGYRVLTARDGYEGLQAVQKERPELVIADIMMPRLDGFGLVNRLRLNPQTREIPVVVITATYVTPEDKEFAQSIGATRFIQKPINLEDFLEVIRELVEQGQHVVLEPLPDLDFSGGYQNRLEAKLEQRNAQISRYQHLLEGRLSDEEHIEIHASLSRAIKDRQEIELLLTRIRERLAGE